MSAHPFRRLGRNTLAALLALPVRDGSTAAGRTLARASRAAMWPDDRAELTAAMRARELQDAINDVIARRRWATGGVVAPHQQRPDRVQALLSPGYALIGGEWRVQGDDAVIDALNAGEGVALTRTCTCRFSTRVGSTIGLRYSDGCEMHDPDQGARG